MTEYVLEVRGDDDVDTDEEIYDNARKACSRDFLDAREKVENNPLNLFVNNWEVERRVRHPEDYDRCAKFRGAYAPVQPRLHASINEMQF